MQNLLAETVRLLRARPTADHEAIADKTGLSKSWVEHLRKGRYKDPGVNKVQRLYEYLTGEKLL